jgi:hypothetical protein
MARVRIFTGNDGSLWLGGRFKNFYLFERHVKNTLSQKPWDRALHSLR